SARRCRNGCRRRICGIWLLTSAMRSRNMAAAARFMCCSAAAGHDGHRKKRDAKMTPFGLRVRGLRKSRGLTLKQMAADLDISAAYLSALEHGHRGRPSWSLVAQICDYFNIIWDEAEELQRLASLSHPKVTVDTSGLSPLATEYANLLALKIRDLPERHLRDLLAYLKAIGSEAER